MKDLLTELKRLNKAVEKGGHYSFSQGIWAECIDRIEILEAPANEVIKLAQADSVDTTALLNAYLKRDERQRRELAKLNARLAQARPDAEAVQAVPALAGKKAVVLYFETDADLDEMVAALRAAKPNMRTEKL